MKRKLLLFISAFSFCTLANAQSIPNPSFETWIDKGGYEDPDGWLTFNFTVGFGIPATVIKSSDAFIDTAAMQLETIEFFNPFTSAMDTIQGYAITGTGDFFAGTAIPGFMYTQKPTALTGHFKYSTPGASIGEVYVYFTKWDAVNGKRDTIGEGYQTFSPAAAYTAFTAPILFTSPDTPDTAAIQFSPNASTIPQPIPGSTLLIDNLAFEGTTTGIKTINKEKAIVFPNPAINEVNFIIHSKEASGITVYDMLGKSKVAGEIISGKAKINVSDFNEGVYIYKVTDKSGGVISNGRFNVIK